MQQKAILSQKNAISQNIRNKINLFTGGMIGVYEQYVVRGIEGSFKTRQKPNSKRDILDHMVLSESFLTLNGEYIGDIKRAEWYLKNNMIISEANPHGVAIVAIKPIEQLYPNGLRGPIDKKYIKGYYGYSHRGGQTFVPGNKLFDEKWSGKNTEQELSALPFIKRGGKTIKNWKDAEQAAINLSQYLS
jgi:hypothetical protein